MYIGDMALLDKLSCEQLERAAKSVRKEGRKWVEVRPRFEYQEQAKFQQLHAKPPALSEELASKCGSSRMNTTA